MILNILVNILDLFSKSISNLSKKIKKKDPFNNQKDTQLLELSYNQSGSFYNFVYSNNYLLENYEIMKIIFHELQNNETFKNFGEYKIIITSAIINGKETAFHHNVLIKNETTFEEYWRKIENYISETYEEGYNLTVIPSFKVRVFNVDDYRNKKIKITKSTLNRKETNKIKNRHTSMKGARGLHTSALLNTKKANTLDLIKPLNFDDKNTLIGDFHTLDIETMGDSKNIQFPVAISICGRDFSKLFIIKLIDNLTNKDELLKSTSDNLWLEFFNYIDNLENKTTFFVHNLGSFDGLFLYKAISLHFKPHQVKTIIDHHNKFITITLKLKNGNTITWLDSYRIFPVSLKDLCKTFKVEGKTQEYNQKFNSLDLFNNESLLEEFKEYSLQDSIALYQALEKAQQIYVENYGVDICTIFSTSSLSLKIFRLKFLKEDIPVIRGNTDSFIRKSYFGGHTDYYKGYMKNGHYYDVNSLYPFAMLKPMPHKLIKFHKNLNIS